MMRTLSRSAVAVAVCLTFGLILPASAQVPGLEPNRTGAPAPVVSFQFERPGVQPPHYSIAVESTGKAAYRAADTPANGQPAGDPFILKFTVSEKNRTLIFDLAREANFFNGNFNYTKSRIADTGIKTLGYTEGQVPNDLEHPDKGRKYQTSYNWSENPAIQKLTNIFQGISATIEFGRRLDFERRFDKLGLDAELKRMEEMQKAGDLEEVQAIAPTLQNLMNDYSVMHIARERAKRILNTALSQTAQK